MAALAIAYAEYGRRAKPMRMKRLFVCGVLAGCIATIKYTLLGAMIGLCAVEGVLALKESGLLRALKSAGCVSRRHGGSDSAVDRLFRGKRGAFPTLTRRIFTTTSFCTAARRRRGQTA